MIVTNRRMYDSMEWDEYVTIPGYSYSRLRNPEGVAPTSKMRLGTLVDRYLFTPEKYTGEQYDLVKPVAEALRDTLGSALTLGKRQLCMTANFEHEGLVMPYKGATDLKIGRLIVDVKVSQLNIIKAVEFFRYDWQVSGYAAGADCDKAMIISVHPKTKKVSKLLVPLVYDWWEWQIKTYGKPNSMPTLRAGE